MDDLPNIHDLIAITKTVESTTDYLLNHECIAFPEICEKCGAENSYSWKDQKFKTIRCSTFACRKSRSVYKGTFMSRSRLNAQQMLLMAHSWLKEDTVKSAHTNLKGIVSRCVIVDFFAYFRQLVVEDLKEVDEVIGGPGIEVEIDESKFARRKIQSWSSCG